MNKVCKRFGIEEPSQLEDGIHAMSYLILHMAKIKASEEEFSILYDQSGLNKKFKKAMFDAVYSYLNEIRELLAKEN